MMPQEWAASTALPDHTPIRGSGMGPRYPLGGRDDHIALDSLEAGKLLCLVGCYVEAGVCAHPPDIGHH